MGAAAIIIRREKQLVEHFRRMNALTPITAQSTNALQVDVNVAFRILRERAVIREAGTGLYYLDEASWEASVRMRRRMAFIVIALVIVVGLVLFFTTSSVRS